jgi:hypothetical protein
MTVKHIALFIGASVLFLLIKSIFIPLTIADALIILALAACYCCVAFLVYLNYKHESSLPKAIEISPEILKAQTEILRMKAKKEQLLAEIELNKVVDGKQGVSNVKQSFTF